jgi:aspartate racemase
MKRIGLLGGMSWESTAQYYRLINEGVRARLGALHSADLVLRSVDFAEIEELFRQDRWDLVGDRLHAEASMLQVAGAEVIALCTNTGHRVIDQVREAVSIPVIDIVDVAVGALQRDGRHRPLVLGTAYTMAPGFYRQHLQAAGIEAVVPKDPQPVDEVIFGELCRGICSAEGRGVVEGAIASAARDDVDSVLLACTELELLEPLDSPVPIYPTTALHCGAVVEWALAGEGDTA